MSIEGTVKKMLASSVSSLCYALSIWKKKAGDILNAKGWIGDKSCPVTIDTQEHH
jgi:hypothetical protein